MCTVGNDALSILLSPFVYAAIAGGFAFITATGSPGVWIPAMAIGIILSYVIALAVRFRAKLSHWAR